MIFFRFAKIFQFFVVAPHQQIFEIFEKVGILQSHEELNMYNGTVLHLSYRDKKVFSCNIICEVASKKT